MILHTGRGIQYLILLQICIYPEDKGKALVPQKTHINCGFLLTLFTRQMLNFLHILAPTLLKAFHEPVEYDHSQQTVHRTIDNRNQWSSLSFIMFSITFSATRLINGLKILSLHSLSMYNPLVPTEFCKNHEPPSTTWVAVYEADVKGGHVATKNITIVCPNIIIQLQLELQ